MYLENAYKLCFDDCSLEILCINRIFENSLDINNCSLITPESDCRAEYCLSQFNVQWVTKSVLETIP